RGLDVLRLCSCRVRSDGHSQEPWKLPGDISRSAARASSKSIDDAAVLQPEPQPRTNASLMGVHRDDIQDPKSVELFRGSSAGHSFRPGDEVVGAHRIPGQPEHFYPVLSGVYFVDCRHGRSPLLMDTSPMPSLQAGSGKEGPKGEARLKTFASVMHYD